jgi:hypothetical protein
MGTTQTDVPDTSKTNVLRWLTHLLVHIEAEGLFRALANLLVSFPPYGRDLRIETRCNLSQSLSHTETQGQRWRHGVRHRRAACHGLF